MASNLSASIAGKWQEIDEIAVLGAAVLPEIGKFGRSHCSRDDREIQFKKNGDPDSSSYKTLETINDGGDVLVSRDGM